jgi:hypothetical protein
MKISTENAAFNRRELFAIVPIVGIIAAVLVPKSLISSEDLELHEHNKSAINAAVGKYHGTEGTWPRNDLSDIAADPAYFPHGLPLNPVDPATPYTIDGETHRVDTP